MKRNTDKLLAEWFWCDRWDGSSAALLPLEARGLYREMLSAAWRRGARLPNDERSIMLAVRVMPEEWARSWPLVKPYWREDGVHIVNDTQLEVYAEAKAAVESARTRSEKANRTRWGVPQGSPRGLHKESPPSPSPSPSPSNEQRTTDNGAVGAANTEQSTGAPVEKSDATATAPTDQPPPVAEYLREVVATAEACMGRKPAGGEMALAKRWHAAGITLRVVVTAIEQATAAARERPRVLGYYDQAVRDEHERSLNALGLTAKPP